MPLYRPSELRSFLTSLGIAPKKSLSQNFLIDGNILKKIVAASGVQAGDVVVEIGPGPGALTELLLETGCQVVAIEKDKTFANALLRLQNESGALEVHSADVMGFSFEEALQKKLAPGKKAKVVANIPYHLTSPIIEKIINSSSVISTATLMVQEEVARRFTAGADSEDFSHISIFMQFYSDVQYAFSVPANCFYPVPKVDSAVIHFEVEKKFAVDDVAAFFLLTRTAFMQKRKMIKASVKKLFPSELVEAALKELGKTERARPSELSVDQWVQLFHKLNNIEI